jgi:transcriptional regulator with XRE-family HTH domain
MKLRTEAAFDVRRCRGALGFSQVQFAALLHVHPGTVSRWENGAKTPSAWHRSVITRLWHSSYNLIPRTLEIAEGELEDGDPGSALALLLTW